MLPTTETPYVKVTIPQQPGQNQNLNITETHVFLNNTTDSVPPFFATTSIRHAFVRKVFGLVSLQLLLTILVVSFIKFYPPVNKFLSANDWLIWVIMGATFILMLVLGCSESVARSHPLNLILLLAFTLMESVLIGFISLAYKTDTLFIAALITALVVFGLTMFSLQTKIDFTGAGTYLCVLVFILMGFGIVSLVVRSHFMSIMYAAMGAGLFSMYLVFDTQLMLGGKHKYAISPEDYVLASLNLYVDVVNLFLMVLNLVRASED